MRKSHSRVRSLVRALAVVMATSASATVIAQDAISMSGVSRFSYGDYYQNAVPAAVVGYQPFGQAGEDYNWSALIQFSIPQGTYSSATLTFSTNPYQVSAGVPDPYAPPAIKVGLFELYKLPFAVDYSTTTAQLVTGKLYGSILHMAWPASFIVPVTDGCCRHQFGGRQPIQCRVHADGVPVATVRLLASSGEHRKRVAATRGSGTRTRAVGDDDRGSFVLGSIARRRNQTA